MTIRRLLATLLVSLGAACSPDGAPRDTAAPSSPTPAAEAGAVVVRFGDERITAEVADDPKELQHGLMGRRALPADAGMLFLMPTRSRTGFWMKNTLIPLSIAYLIERGSGDYEVVAIVDMEPCTADPCHVYDPGSEYDAAVEANKGWFADHRVRVGAEAVVEGTLER